MVEILEPHLQIKLHTEKMKPSVTICALHVANTSCCLKGNALVEKEKNRLHIEPTKSLVTKRNTKEIFHKAAKRAKLAYQQVVGKNTLSGTIGPMARDLDGLVLATKAILCDYMFELDRSIPPVPFRDEIFQSKRPLKIGYYVNDGYLQSVPACQRVVMMAKTALEAQGHTVISFDPPDVPQMWTELYLKSVAGDGGRTFLEAMQKDILDDCMQKLCFSLTVPRWLLGCLKAIIRLITQDPVQTRGMTSLKGCRSVYEWWQQAKAVEIYKDKFQKKWCDLGLDGVVCPVFACAAVPHGDVSKLIGAGTYPMLYNVLNYPAGSLPLTKVTSEDVQRLENYPSRRYFEKNIKKASEDSVGLPVNVQCVCLPFQEELVLRVMKEIETGLKSMGDH